MRLNQDVFKKEITIKDHGSLSNIKTVYFLRLANLEIWNALTHFF